MKLCRTKITKYSFHWIVRTHADATGGNDQVRTMHLIL